MTNYVDFLLLIKDNIIELKLKPSFLGKATYIPLFADDLYVTQTRTVYFIKYYKLLLARGSCPVVFKYFVNNNDSSKTGEYLESFSSIEKQCISNLS